MADSIMRIVYSGRAPSGNVQMHDTAGWHRLTEHELFRKVSGETNLRSGGNNREKNEVLKMHFKFCTTIGNTNKILDKVLGAFAKFRKATISFLMSLCPLTLGSHRKDFNEISYLGFLRKPIEKIQVELKSEKNKEYLHESVFTFMAISR
jgi:hypothetical protein